MCPLWEAPCFHVASLELNDLESDKLLIVLDSLNYPAHNATPQKKLLSLTLQPSASWKYEKILPSNSRILSIFPSCPRPHVVARLWPHLPSPSWKSLLKPSPRWKFLADEKGTKSYTRWIISKYVTYVSKSKKATNCTECIHVGHGREWIQESIKIKSCCGHYTTVFAEHWNSHLFHLHQKHVVPMPSDGHDVPVGRSSLLHSVPALAPVHWSRFLCWIGLPIISWAGTWIFGRLSLVESSTIWISHLTHLHLEMQTFTTSSLFSEPPSLPMAAV